MTKDRSFKLYLLGFGIIWTAVFLLTFSVNIYAMSTVSDYPCYVNQNGNIPSEVIMYVDQTYGQSYFVYLGSSIGTGTYGGGIYPLYAFPKNSSGSLYANINSDNTFSLIGYNIGYYDAKVGSVSKNYAGSWSTSIISGNYTYWWYQNRISSMIDSSVDYYTNFDLMSNSDHTQKVISTGTPPLVLPDGDDPSLFDDTGLNLDSSLNASYVPTAPSGFSYTAPTAPTWDGSQPVQSVWDYIVYGFSCLIALLQGVINTISNWISYIGNLLSYVVQKILDFLKAIVVWLYQQFLDWLTPYLKLLVFLSKIFFNEEEQINIFDLISDFKDELLSSLSGLFSGSFFSSYWTNFQTYLETVFSNISKVILFFSTLIVLGTDPNTHEFSIPYLTQVLLFPDLSSVELLIINHDIFDFHTLMPILITSGKTMVTTLQNVTPSHTFHVPSLVYHNVQIGNFDIDFSWYDNYKTYVDAIISGFLIIGWLYWVFVSFSHFLRGTAGQGSEPASDNYAAGWHYDL